MISNLPEVKIGKNKIKSYNGDLMKFGKMGESIMVNWLKAHPEVIDVRDVSELTEIQSIDADIIVCLREGGKRLAEIKTDRHLGETGNIPVEILRLNHFGPEEATGVLGWTLSTEARWILYYAPLFGYVYQFKTVDLRRCIQLFTKEKRDATPLCWVSTDNVKSTLLILLPVSACRNTFKVHDVIDFTGGYAPKIKQLRLKFTQETLLW